MLIDTHCHLTHELYDEDRIEVLVRARRGGVGDVISIASDLDDAAAIQELAGWVGELDALATVAPDDLPALAEVAEPEPADSDVEDDDAVRRRGRPARVRGTVGVHPHEAGEAPADLRTRLLEFLDAHPQVVAVGECGLDYHYDFTPPPLQRKVFRVQMEVAEERGLPVVVHCRDAEEEMGRIVRVAGEAGVRGVLHCFPGDLRLLDEALDAGWLVSFTGLVTFSSFEGVEALRRVPADRYMLETDGPYMAPVPYRGRRNEPAWVPLVRDRVAEARQEPAEAVERITTENARRFFGP